MTRDQLSIAFDAFAYRYFAPAIIGYADILLERVVPLFDDVDAEQERVAQSVINASGWGPDDYEAAIEAAHDYAIDAAIRFMEMRTVFLATGVSGLFHLFERQLYTHLNKELRDWISSPINQWRDLEEIIPKFRQRWRKEGEDLALINAFQNPDLIELRLVANAVKHGEGSSYKQLQTMNAVVVWPDRLEQDWTVGPSSVFGVKLFVQPDDVKRYRDSILRVWRVEGTYWAPRSAFKI